MQNNYNTAKDGMHDMTRHRHPRYPGHMSGSQDPSVYPSLVSKCSTHLKTTSMNE